MEEERSGIVGLGDLRVSRFMTVRFSRLNLLYELDSITKVHRGGLVYQIRTTVRILRNIEASTSRRKRNLIPISQVIKKTHHKCAEF